MTTTKAVTIAVAALLATATLAADQIPESADPAAIPNYHRMSPILATAGQPTLDALRQIKAQGFKTVISLRAESEGPAEERGIVEGLGLRFVRIPLKSSKLGMQDADQVASILDDPEAQPVLLHCVSSNRVGAVWTLIQVRKGKPIGEALSDGKTAGLTNNALIETVKRIAAESATKPQ